MNDTSDIIAFKDSDEDLKDNDERLLELFEYKAQIEERLELTQAQQLFAILCFYDFARFVIRPFQALTSSVLHNQVKEAYRRYCEKRSDGSELLAERALQRAVFDEMVGEKDSVDEQVNTYFKQGKRINHLAK